MKIRLLLFLFLVILVPGCTKKPETQQRPTFETSLPVNEPRRVPLMGDPLVPLNQARLPERKDTKFCGNWFYSFEGEPFVYFSSSSSLPDGGEIKLLHAIGPGEIQIVQDENYADQPAIEDVAGASFGFRLRVGKSDFETCLKKLEKKK